MSDIVASLSSISASVSAATERPLVVNKNVVTYKGHGYLYHFHKSARDLIAKLKISRFIMEQFVKGKGECNTRKLPGLTVACQGGGWYEIFVIDEAKVQSVVLFLKKLNQWMLAQVYVSAKEPIRAHRFVEARKYEHAQARTQGKKLMATPYTANVGFITAVPLAQPSRLEALALTINTKYGKNFN
jgi:hypothetical protein